VKHPAISGAEWQVLQAVWERHPSTAGEIVRRLEGKTEWRPRTIKTLLNRLVSKGAVSCEKDGARYLYSPRVRREECVREESRSFLERVFGGAAAPALVHFVEQAELSRAEIDQLKAILERKKGRRK